MNQPQKKIICNKCTHFYITWEKNHPYGCRRMGFKSKQMPSVVVRKNSGKSCLHFKEKKPDK